MGRNLKFYSLPFLLLLILIVLQVLKPKEESAWVPSFSKEDKIPYGAYLLWERLPDLFPGGLIYPTQTAPFDFFEDSLNYFQPTAYVAFNLSLPIEGYDLSYLLDFVAEGKTAVLISQDFSSPLMDSLGFRLNEPLPFSNIEDSVKADFVNPSLESDSGYHFEELLLRAYFSEFDTSTTTVLARNHEGEANLLQVSHGDGQVLLCSVPFYFTNYHLLHKNHHDFLAKVFSYVPSSPNSMVIWDEYYKYWHLKALAEGKADGRLGYILNQEALSWAWYLLIISFLIFALFEVKRKQRIVPVIKPLPNLTLDFTQTIGRLYHQSGDHHNIAEKKIKVFLDMLRSRYFLRADSYDAAFFKSLSGKSGVAVSDLKPLFNLIKKIQQTDHISETRLIDLSQRIEDFYRKSGYVKDTHPDSV